MVELDHPSIIKNSHWSYLILYLGQYGEDQYQFALSLTYEQFWETCPKGEWLLHWIIKEGNTDRKAIVHAACQCVRLVLPYCTDKQQRPLKAIETTEKWIRGEATSEEVKQAGNAAWNAGFSASSAGSPVYYAAYASSAIGFANYAAHAANYAAHAAYYAACVVSSSETAKQAMQLQTADLVRSLIPIPIKLVDEYEHILKLKAFL